MNQRRNVFGLLERALQGALVMLMALTSQPGVSARPEVVWETFGLGPVSALTVGPDGTVYAGSRDNHLYAFSPEGGKKWSFDTGGSVRADPVIGPSGTIYVGAAHGVTYALTPEGEAKWRTELGESPALGPDGTVYVVSNFKTALHALSPDGTKKWGREFTNPSSVSRGYKPAIGPSGTIYVTAVSKLYAVGPDGERKWVYEEDPRYEISLSAAAGHDGTIYVRSNPGTRLQALTPEGIPVWSMEFETFVGATPSVGPSGIVYVPTSVCTAVNPTKALWSVLGIEVSKVWTFEANGASGITQPEIASDGTVYIGSGYGVHAITPSGKSKWTYPVYHALSVAIGDEGKIYAGSEGGRLYALEADP
jgi:outer membrane protein assembly factor BamB